MRILYFDCFSGISGDMTIGALLNLGIDRDVFLEELDKLGLDGYEIEISTKTVNGIRGTDVNVVLNAHSHGGRGLVEIERLIDKSSLSGFVKSFSKRVFREIAAAEAKVHNRSIYDIHFHEIGAVDSIVDIAGTAICLELLGVERIYSSALHDGSGFIECAHGTIPVPVPAVMEMLAGSGIPLVSEDIGTELVTPTGMALIKCMASSFGSRPAMLVEKTGYGHGKRNTGRLNALRVILGETYEEKHVEGENISVLETNIDDTTGEILGYTMSRLMESGALDVFYTPVYMKKNRPAYMLTVLADRDKEDRLAEIIMQETSTLGIRVSRVKRYKMERETVSINTPYGEARVKISTYGDIKKAAPEYEDCKKIAEKSGLPLAKAYEMVAADAAKQYGV